MKICSRCGAMRARFFPSCMGFRRPEVQVFSPRCLKALGANASEAFPMSLKTDISVCFGMFWKVRGVQNGVQPSSAFLPV